MRVKNLDVGVEQISRWQIADETHLPVDAKIAPKFMPGEQALERILNRPSLDERLPRLLQPEFIDPDLLEPSVLAEQREAVLERFTDASKTAKGAAKTALNEAVKVLSDELEFDGEIREALATLMRG